MNTTANVDAHSDNLIKRIFTDPTSEAFRVWVGLVNFWVIVLIISISHFTIRRVVTFTTKV